jgi:5-methylcytosine-specific restriction endonuclease McrA
VIRLQELIRRPRPRVKLNRREVFARDGYTCQYCGTSPHRSQLNLDHVVPRSHGGKTCWENVVTSCIPCNARKANRTPEQARMTLRSRPQRPEWVPLVVVSLGRNAPAEWKTYCYFIDDKS